MWEELHPMSRTPSHPEPLSTVYTPSRGQLWGRRVSAALKNNVKLTMRHNEKRNAFVGFTGPVPIFVLNLRITNTKPNLHIGLCVCGFLLPEVAEPKTPGFLVVHFCRFNTRTEGILSVCWRSYSRNAMCTIESVNLDSSQSSPSSYNTRPG